MQNKGPESIPEKQGAAESKKSARLRQKTQKKVTKRIDCTILASCGINGLPSCLSWIEYPIHEKHLSIFIGITERELLNEPIYITKVDNGGMVQSQIQLKKNPSGLYNINFAQCQFSRAGILGMMSILDNATHYNVAEDCSNYLLLLEFFDNISIDEGILTGIERLDYDGQEP